MNPRDRVMKVLRHEIPDRVPVWEVLIDAPVVEKMVGVSGINSWQLEPEKIIDLHLGLRLDAINLPAPFWKAREMKNQMLRVSELVPPSNALIDAAIERIEKVAQLAHQNGLAMAGYNHGCFDIVYESLGFEHFMSLLYENPDYVREVNDYLFDYHVRIMEKLAKTSVDWILIGDDIAYKSGLFVRPEMFLDLWYDKEKYLIDMVKKTGRPVEYHTDGKLEVVLPWLIEMGVDLVNPVEPYANDIFELKKKYGQKIGFRGNIEVLEVLADGDAQQTYETTRKLVLGMKSGGNYVCSSSHSLTGNVNLENYRAMVQAVNDVGGYE